MFKLNETEPPLATERNGEHTTPRKITIHASLLEPGDTIRVGDQCDGRLALWYLWELHKHIWRCTREAKVYRHIRSRLAILLFDQDYQWGNSRIVFQNP